MTWQKCPICNGSGEDPIQPYVNKLVGRCPTCLGQRIIHAATGKPPANEVKTGDTGLTDEQRESIAKSWGQKL